MRMEVFYQKLSGLLPAQVIVRLRTLLLQAGIDKLSAQVFTGFVMFFSISLSLLFFLVLPMFTRLDFVYQLALSIFFLFTLFFLFYLFIEISVQDRARKIEDALPDALHIISSNIRSGMTLEQAFWGSARPEFGALNDEIRKVSADAFGGKPLAGSLAAMSKRVRSVILERAIRLITEGIKLGGEMGRLLDSVADDINGTKTLQREISTSTLTYVIFIVFASMLAAPLLFSVSVYYSEMNDQLLNKQVRGGGNVPASVLAQAKMSGMPSFILGGQAKGASISPDQVYWFAVACICIVTFFAGLIIGMVREGNAWQGMKFSPFFMIVSLIIFTLVLGFLRASFATFLK